MAVLKVEFLYFEECPSHHQAYDLLLTCMTEEDIPLPLLQKIKVDTEEKAIDHEFIGSPSIRVNGKDIEESQKTNYSLSCRVYRDGEKLSGIPPKQLILNALKA